MRESLSFSKKMENHVGEPFGILSMTTMHTWQRIKPPSLLPNHHPCLDHPNAANQIFLISDNQAVSTPQLIRLIAQRIQQPCQLLPIPTTLLRFLGYLGDRVESITGKNLPFNTYNIDRLLGSLAVDSSYIQKTLNWQPPFTLEQGLAQTIQPEN